MLDRSGSKWALSSLRAMIHNPFYCGEGRNNSRYAGDGTRPVPALVDAETWQQAQAALLRNRKLSKRGAKNFYLLRGLVKCTHCGGGYVGSPGADGNPIYRCVSQCGTREYATRCDAKSLRADWLEDAVWQECRRFILNPGEALTEARRKMRERMADAAGFEQQRRDLLHTLAGKEGERERVLTLYRRGKISDLEAETQLDDC